VRIAIDARELLGRPTGVGRYLSNLLREWNDLPGAAAHEFVLCADAAVDGHAWPQLRVSSAVTGGRLHGTLWEQLVLPRLAGGASVLFCPGYTAPLAAPAPTVVTVHDVSFAAHPEWFSWREGLRRRTLTRLGARRAAKVVTVSDFSKREIVRHLGVPAARVDVIYSGRTALPYAPAARREPVVLYVGSLFNRRHLPELIEGFGRVAAAHPGARLEIVGDNRTRPHVDVAALGAASPAREAIRIRDYVPDAELARLYARASVFAFLSEYEGFAMTPMEALAAGVPIVLLDTEVAREIYGAAALFVARPDPALIAAALDRLLGDAAERARLLAATEAQMARYSWRECAQRTLQVLLACARP
jgi:glycosyltransferase involved in cell wall biosynthesis